MKIKQLLLLVAFFGTTAFAQNVTVTEAWARATVQGQKASGAFMKITAKDDEKLIGASSAAAGVVQIHEMKMEKDVMKMNAVDSIALPAGQTVVLQRGGYHVMLMDIKKPLVESTTIPLTLFFVNAKGEKSQIDIQLPVRQSEPEGHMNHRM